MGVGMLAVYRAVAIFLPGCFLILALGVCVHAAAGGPRSAGSVKVGEAAKTSKKRSALSESKTAQQSDAAATMAKWETSRAAQEAAIKPYLKIKARSEAAKACLDQLGRVDASINRYFALRALESPVSEAQLDAAIEELAKEMAKYRGMTARAAAFMGSAVYSALSKAQQQSAVALNNMR